MSELYRKVRDAEVESYPSGRTTTVPIYEPVEPDYEVTYCPVHDVTWPVNHERCGLIVLAHYPEVDDE